MRAALYRKYRPALFSDVSGQGHVTRTLMNAIEMGRVSHAYLFCGVRGVGKTSVARIFSKAVDCLNLKKGEPCDECEMCLDFKAGRALDLIEIDAASNRGIDEIRDLREKIKFAPNKAKYKVFIIDEVHMLTKEAFNALLKTLEEPPAHAIFILATTEAHKVPETIISRCQRFDFQKIGLKTIADHLESIASKENFEFDKKALEIIAAESGGSFRDAISLLDQVSSFNNGKISLEEARLIVGHIDLEIITGFVWFLVQGKTKDALDLIEKLVEDGRDVMQFIKNTTVFLRSAMLYKFTKKQSELFSKESLERIANALSEKEIIDMVQDIANVEKQARVTSIPQLPLEIAVIKFTLPEGREIQQKGSKKNETSAGKESVASAGDKWEEFLLEVKAENHSVHALLRAAQPELSSKELKLHFQYQFHKERVEDNKNKLILEKAASKVYGQPLKVKCVILAGGAKITKEKPEVNLENQLLEIFEGEIIS
ncbi:MAG: polymerase III, subunit gamma and tau protein [candidate division CPR2 bacterium GW2011_GWC1_39_9]|uniref:DNA polymerase III subunit gamma/tau n=1 Tax=candidate division CPR2 bacterium GW2011_GWC2_39_10 TaxID=1618345 RepID=A0A0G0LSH3_UNCC2|nr:MAG: polymerase III, subunit gamma and tau protein [candidate division CPR2 bacterium GW2011_GWC2_39_10]KKR33914.1 MAG: polymerase III, subunit gamma and tau protein [candidate division CPR2 bacterium GW2011_GWC1_39_9]